MQGAEGHQRIIAAQHRVDPVGDLSAQLLRGQVIHRADERAPRQLVAQGKTHQIRLLHEFLFVDRRRLCRTDLAGCRKTLRRRDRQARARDPHPQTLQHPHSLLKARCKRCVGLWKPRARIVDHCDMHASHRLSYRARKRSCAARATRATRATHSTHTTQTTHTRYTRHTSRSTDTRHTIHGDTDQRIHDDGAVFHRPCEGARDIERPAVGENSPRRQAPRRWDQANRASRRGRQAHRARRVRTQREHGGSGRDRCSRARRRTAGEAFSIPGISRRGEGQVKILAAIAGAEFPGCQFADQDRPGRLELCDQGRVPVRHMIQPEARARGRGHAGHIIVVLDGEGYAMQRPLPLACGDLRFGQCGCRARLRRRHVNIGMNPLIDFADACQKRFEQRNGRQRSRSDSRRCLGQRQGPERRCPIPCSVLGHDHQPFNVLNHPSTSALDTTSPYFALMSNNDASCGPSWRSPTHSRGTTTR